MIWAEFSSFDCVLINFDHFLRIVYTLFDKKGLRFLGSLDRGDTIILNPLPIFGPIDFLLVEFLRGALDLDARS